MKKNYFVLGLTIVSVGFLAFNNSPDSSYSDYEKATSGDLPERYITTHNLSKVNFSGEFPDQEKPCCTQFISLDEINLF